MIKGSIPQIDCMIDAKRKDEALFKIMEKVKKGDDVETIDGSSIHQ